MDVTFLAQRDMAGNRAFSPPDGANSSAQSYARRMEGLILRLADLDEGALGAVRIIAFFDGFVEHRASLDTVLSATARFAECEVGISGGAAEDVFVSADGAVVPGARSPAHALRAPIGDDRSVWLGRQGAPLAQDRMLLERFGFAVRALSPEPNAHYPGFGDPALLEVVLGARADEMERARALHLLGLDPPCPITVYALRMADPGENAEFVADRHPWVLSVQIGDVRAVIGQGIPRGDTTPPAGVQVGRSGPATAASAATAWRGARTALRFAGSGLPAELPSITGGSALVVEEMLGVWADIAANTPVERLSAAPDVVAVAALAAEAGGAETVAMLIAVCATASLRQAAATLYVHHSTLTARLAKVERLLGFAVDTPQGRLRLSTCLIIRQICSDPVEPNTL